MTTSLKLRPFQQVCSDMMIDAWLSHDLPNVLIGDDMGLGKTVEAIDIDRRKRALKGTAGGRLRTLIVAPLSVTGVWRRHLQAWNPSLKVMVLDPKDRGAFERRLELAARNSDVYETSPDVFICHWESLRLMPALHKVKWFHIIGDEIHRIKNREAQQTVQLKKLRTEHKMGLSGTAANNRPDDLWSVLNWLYPGQFTSYWRFYNHHNVVLYHDEAGINCGCLEKFGRGHKRSYREVVGTANIPELADRMKLWYIRRLKEDVLHELPDKYFETIWVDLTPKQRKAYEQMRKKMLAWVGKHEDQPLAAPIVVTQLLRLQQFAVAFGELEVVQRNVLEDATDDNGNIIYDDRGKPKRRVAKDKFGKPLKKDVTVLRLTEPSSKLDAVMQIIEDNPEKQIVVFSQSKQVINMLGKRLAAKGIKAGLLTGDTKKDRGDLVEKFQRGDLRIFAGTIAAGGEGITLHAASTIIFLDRQWSPSLNKQAEDRLHRIGQKNAVQVIDIIARQSVDLGRLQQIQTKWSWLRQILGDDPTAIQEEYVSRMEMFKEEVEEVLNG